MEHGRFAGKSALLTMRTRIPDEATFACTRYTAACTLRNCDSRKFKERREGSRRRGRGYAFRGVAQFPDNPLPSSLHS